MKIRPYIPRFGRPPHWLLEGLFIVASVLLAFGITEYGEYRDNRELAKRVLTNLVAEVEHNLATVEPEIAIHSRWFRAIYQWLETHPTSGGDEAAMNVFISTWPDLDLENPKPPLPVPRRAAWDAAVSTGALRYIDYDLVAGLSEIYQFQETLGASELPPQGLAFFDPAARTASLRQVGFALEGLMFGEKILVDMYKKHLPAIRAAAAAE